MVSIKTRKTELVAFPRYKSWERMLTGTVACHAALHAQQTCTMREIYGGSLKSQGEIHLLGTKNQQIGHLYTLCN